MNKFTLVEEANRFFDSDEVIEESEQYSNTLLESANNIATILEDEETKRIFLVYLKGDFKTPFIKEYDDIQSANNDLKSYHIDSKAKVIQATNPQIAIDMWKKDMIVIKEDEDILDEFTKAYIEAALWSSTDDNDNPLDSNYTMSDIAPETLEKIKNDCKNFQDANGQLLIDGGWSDDSQAGHDFWLSRNGHGAGFFDRTEREGYNEEIGEKLQNICR